MLPTADFKLLGFSRRTKRTQRDESASNCAPASAKIVFLAMEGFANIIEAQLSLFEPRVLIFDCVEGLAYHLVSLGDLLFLGDQIGRAFQQNRIGRIVAESLFGLGADGRRRHESEQQNATRHEEELVLK